MSLGAFAGVIPRLRGACLVARGLASQGADDAELLELFVSTRDEEAFELLVRRHGPMVLAVCRRVLRHTHDAEDAFQATFLVLAHRARVVSPRSALAGWLYGVAHRTALKARHRAARRAEVERRAPARSTEPMPPESNWDEVEPLLDAELAALPERYRLAIILCDLQGRLRTEAATALGCSEGTLSSRLTRGRRLLAERLKRRGVQLSAAALVTALSGRSIVLAEPLIRSTVPAALSAVSASAVSGAGAASPSVAELATGVMKSMFLKKLQTLAVAAFVVAAVAAGLTTVIPDRSEAAAPVPKPAAGADDKAVVEALADVDSQLLMNRKVMKDLKVEFDQFDKIMDTMEAAQQASYKKTNEAMMNLKVNPQGGNFNPEAFQKMMQEAQEAGQKELRKAVAGVVADTLTAAQRKRLREIDLQYRGHEAFTSPAVAKTLELTDKQKEKFAANVKRVEEDVNAAFQKPIAVPIGVPGGPGGAVAFDYNKVISDARAEGLKRAVEILTDDQKATWKKMTGEAFTHPINRPWAPGTRVIGGGGFGIGGGGIQVMPALPPGGGKIVPLPAPPIQVVPAVPAVPALPATPAPATVPAAPGK
jgi:RNA polymerase sigma factor (sigma-70 family)